MLMSSLFGDALMRDIIPNNFPQPEDEVAARYVGAFLRGLGVRTKPSQLPAMRPAS
jgi:hypothetical protein